MNQRHLRLFGASSSARGHRRGESGFFQRQSGIRSLRRKEVRFSEAPGWHQTYDMTMSEHNFALILVCYLWNFTPENRRLTLERFLRPAYWHPDQNPDEYVERDYKNICKAFWSQINKERHAVAEKGAVPGPALACLNAFQQPEGELMAFLRPVSLGDVRRIDLHQLATQPGKGYLQFLADWYN